MKCALLASSVAALVLSGCGGGGDMPAQPGEMPLAANSPFSLRTVINGGFETGDVSNWQVDIDLGYSGLFIPHERPAGTVNAVNAWNFGATTRLPRAGNYFLKVCTGNEWFDGQGTYNITAHQRVLLHKGDTVVGASFYFNGDFAAQDTAWVKVFDKFGTLLATPWIEFSGNGAPGDHNSVPYVHSTDWTAWQWQAPKTGVYTLTLGATTYGDNRFVTCGFHDAIAIVEAGKPAAAAPPVQWPRGIPRHAPVLRH